MMASDHIKATNAPVPARPEYIYHQSETVSPWLALGELVFLAAVLAAIWRRNR